MTLQLAIFIVGAILLVLALCPVKVAGTIIGQNHPLIKLIAFCFGVGLIVAAWKLPPTRDGLFQIFNFGFGAISFALGLFGTVKYKDYEIVADNIPIRVITVLIGMFFMGIVLWPSYIQHISISRPPQTATPTAIPSPTAMVTFTPTPTATFTPTVKPTPFPTVTPTVTPSPKPTVKPTPRPPPTAMPAAKPAPHFEIVLTDTDNRKILPEKGVYTLNVGETVIITVESANTDGRRYEIRWQQGGEGGELLLQNGETNSYKTTQYGDGFVLAEMWDRQRGIKIAEKNIVIRVR